MVQLLPHVQFSPKTLRIILATLYKQLEKLTSLIFSSISGLSTRERRTLIATCDEVRLTRREINSRYHSFVWTVHPYSLPHVCESSMGFREPAFSRDFARQIQQYSRITLVNCSESLMSFIKDFCYKGFHSRVSNSGGGVGGGSKCRLRGVKCVSPDEGLLGRSEVPLKSVGNKPGLNRTSLFPKS